MYCKHCGREIATTDKFCKYCGGLVAETNENTSTDVEVQHIESNTDTKKTKAKKGIMSKIFKGERNEQGKYVSKTVLDDMVHEERTIIREKHIDESTYYALDDIVLIKQGTRKKLQLRNIIVTFVCLVGAIGFAMLALLSKNLFTNTSIAYVMLFGSMIIMFVCFMWLVETFYNFRGLNELKENQIVAKKYGLKKPAQLLLDDEVYDVTLTTDCEACTLDPTSEVIGDLHIEKIANELIAVCNMNRRHIWHINEQAIFDAIAKGSIIIKQKGDKPTINKWKDMIATETTDAIEADTVCDADLDLAEVDTVENDESIQEYIVDNTDKSE